MSQERDEVDKDLPYPWFRYFSEDGEEYFFNEETEEVTWEHPCCPANPTDDDPTETTLAPDKTSLITSNDENASKIPSEDPQQPTLPSVSSEPVLLHAQHVQQVETDEPGEVEETVEVAVALPLAPLSPSTTNPFDEDEEEEGVPIVTTHLSAKSPTAANASTSASTNPFSAPATNSSSVTTTAGANPFGAGPSTTTSASNPANPSTATRNAHTNPFPASTSANPSTTTARTQAPTNPFDAPARDTNPFAAGPSTTHTPSTNPFADSPGPSAASSGGTSSILQALKSQRAAVKDTPPLVPPPHTLVPPAPAPAHSKKPSSSILAELQGTKNAQASVSSNNSSLRPNPPAPPPAQRNNNPPHSGGTKGPLVFTNPPNTQQQQPARPPRRSLLSLASEAEEEEHVHPLDLLNPALKRLLQHGVRKRVAMQMLSAHGNSFALAMRGVNELLCRETNSHTSNYGGASSSNGSNGGAGAGAKSVKHIWSPRLEIRIRSWLPKMQEGKDFHTGYVASVTYSPLAHPAHHNPHTAGSPSPITWQRILKFKDFKAFHAVVEKYAPAHRNHALNPPLTHTFPASSFFTAHTSEYYNATMEALDAYVHGICVHPVVATSGGCRGAQGGEVCTALFDLVGFHEAVSE